MKLRIEKMVYGGAGLGYPVDSEAATAAGLVLFTLPGEVVEAEPTAEAGGEARLVQVLERSVERQEPRCGHFGECGGCQYQHVEYAVQVRMKARILRETLEGVGLANVPKVQVHAGEAWEYRNRIRLRVHVEEGTLRVGYSRRGGNEFLAIRECAIAAPVLWRAAEALMEVARTESVASRWARSAVEVEFFAIADESRLQMTLFVRKELAGGFADFCEAMRLMVPELVGAGVAVMQAEGAQKRRLERVRAGATWGVAGLKYGAMGREYWVSRGGFFQVNRWLVEELAGVVTAGRKGLLAWDLYAGVGLFSRVLAEGFAQVVAVEGGEVAARDLAGALKGKGMQSFCAATVEFLRAVVVQRERPELVVMDPPRAGVGAEVCALLVRVCAPEMVYVSCDPVTLARDVMALVEGGYKVVDVHMLDMFPQTFHLESVVVLRR